MFIYFYYLGRFKTIFNSDTERGSAEIDSGPMFNNCSTDS